MKAAAKQDISYPAKEMNIKQKKTMVLQAIQQTQTISDIAKENQVSRKFVYKQKDKATQAIEDNFSEPATEKVLFYLPVTKSWLL